MHWLKTSIHSIRTRYSIVTAIFMLATLAVFYIGSRIVLVHFIRDTESQVRNIAMDINLFVNNHTAHTRKAALGAAAVRLESPADHIRGDVKIAARFTPAGEFVAAAAGRSGQTAPVEATSFAPYLAPIRKAFAGFAPEKPTAPFGFINIEGILYHAALVRESAGTLLVIGTEFNLADFTRQVNSNFTGFRINVAPRRAGGPAAAPGGESFKLGEFFTTAVNYYSGGFWELGSQPFEAFYTISDAAGTPISSIAVSMPGTFSGTSSAAMARLSLFIAAIGVVIIIPVLWAQGNMLLNPLTKMTETIHALAMQRDRTDCPRIAWTGRDEFANLAASVNVLLESIAERTAVIAENDNRQRAILANFPDALAVFDSDARLVSVLKQTETAAPIPGLTPGETLPPAVFGLTDAAKFTAAVRGLFPAGSQNPAAKCNISNAAKSRRFEIRITRMDARLALATIRDVTEEAEQIQMRRRADLQLSEQRKQESLALFAAGIAHDLNNVLALINNTAEIMSIATPDDTTRESLDTIRDSVRHGSQMMRELMTYAGEIRTALTPCNPGKLLADSKRMIRGAVPQNIELSYTITPDLPQIDADADQLWKVFFNLAKNAAEAIGDQTGCISLTAAPFTLTAENNAAFSSPGTAKFGPGALFTVSDTGCGIPEDLLPTIFDPYVSGKASGRGLGLAIVNSIVEAHGGRIGIDSEFQKGTTFRIFIPASAAPQTAADPEAAPAKALDGGTVILIDDDPAILRTTTILLKTIGVKTETASNRHDAMLLIRRAAAAASAVILDAHLGNVSTLHLLRGIRSIAPGLPVIIASGSNSQTIGDLFNRQPFDRFLAKPYTIAELKTALAAVAKK